jgi:ubiquinone/menaquinone biosynthesis C-methylase UbiE/DNA-binding transcriptional ArsR family regulator
LRDVAGAYKHIFMSSESDARKPQGLSRVQALAALRGAGEATRLRILALLACGELNVKDLTQILGQSQPRISRHLKLMADAGLVKRFREGSWVFFRLAESGAEAELAEAIVANLDPADLTLARDRARAQAVQKARAEAAQAYFKDHAGEWDQIRALHVAEQDVEAAMDEALGEGPFNLLVDLGTGTGRILELFAPRAARALGFDLNHAMLAYARMKLERAGLGHAQVRHGDLYNVPLPDGAADAVVLHQVLHFLDDPAAALAEAGRVLAPGGKLLVVDFAPHELEFLREQAAHRRLGFARDQLDRWLAGTGLKLERFRELKPEPAAGKLTVSLWLGAKPALAGKKRKPAHKVEAAA